MHFQTQWKIQALPNLRVYLKNSIVCFMVYCISGLFNVIIKPTTSLSMKKSVAEETEPELTKTKHVLLAWPVIKSSSLLASALVNSFEESSHCCMIKILVLMLMIMWSIMSVLAVTIATLISIYSSISLFRLAIFEMSF